MTSLDKRMLRKKELLVRLIEESCNVAYPNNATRVADHRDAVEYILMNYRLIRKNNDAGRER